MKGVTTPGLIRPKPTAATMEQALRWLFASLQAAKAFPGLRFPRPIWFTYQARPSVN